MNKIEELTQRAKSIDNLIADLQRKLDEARLLQVAVKQMLQTASRLGPEVPDVKEQ